MEESTELSLLMFGLRKKLNISFPWIKVVKIVFFCSFILGFFLYETKNTLYQCTEYKSLKPS